MPVAVAHQAPRDVAVSFLGLVKQAGAATATRDLRRAQTDDVKNTRELVPAITPEGVPIIGADGNPVLVRRDQRGAILSRSAARVTEQDNKDAGRPPNAGRPQQPRKLDGKQAEQLADAVAVTLTSLGVGDIDPATKTAIANEARVFTYKDTAIVTPNSDTPYSLLWMDLRAEPIVLSVPAVDKKRYYSVQLTDGEASTWLAFTA